MRAMALSVGPPLELTEHDPPDAVSALVRAAGSRPGHAVVAVRPGDTPLRCTYPELLDLARRLLSGLRARGLAPGAPVLLHGLPLADFFPAFWACVLGGLRPVTIAEPWSPDAPSAATERFRHVCGLLDDPVVLTGAASVPDLRGLATGAAVVDVRELPGEPAAETHVPDVDEVALLMLSSGSTGRPKAVRLTHRGLASLAAGARRVLDIRPEDVTFNWLPLDHSGAFLLYHLVGVFAGSTTVHAPTDWVLGDPLRWLDAIVEHDVRHSWAPTFGYQLVTDALAREPRRHWDLSGVRTLVSGGEQVTVPVFRRFLDATEDFGVRAEHIVPVWGMAETTTAITFGRFTTEPFRILKSTLGSELVDAGGAADEHEVATFVSVGPPAPGATARVVDERNEVLAERRIGRLQIRADRVTPGYLGDEETTKAAFPDHERTGRTWLDSGDLAFIAGGEVVVTGRAKDVIVLNGHNHQCHEIEEIAAAAAGAAAGSVAACGIPDARTGSEYLAIFLATDADANTNAAHAIRAALFERLQLTAVRVVPVPTREFPRTPAGKVRRGTLRDRLRTDPPPALHSGQNTVDNGIVREAVRSLLGREVDEHAPFYELGMTSVLLARLRTLLEERLGREVPATTVFRYPSVARLAAHLTSDRTPAAEAPPENTAHPGRVAIIGMALRFPGADTPEEFWANLRDGVDSVRTFARDEVVAAGVPEHVASAPELRPVAGVLSDVDSFDAGFFGITPREAELTDPAHRLFLQCCQHALEHAGYGDAHGRRIGVFAGSGMNLYGHQDQHPRPAAPDPAEAIQATVGAAPDFLASRVAYRLGLTGPAIGVQTACSTSLVAVHLAAAAVRDGDADLALAGAAAVRLPQEGGYRHHPGSILSPTGRCRAFDAAADGTVGGNGVAVVVLKPLDAALADGDTVHAVLLGSAVNNDGQGKVGFTAPSVSGQVSVIREALRRAGVPAESVSYVEAHATGTELGDPVEFDALAEAFSVAGRTGFCTVGSVKPNIGHLDSCAGMAGLIKTTLMLRHRELVPTVHLDTPNPALRLAGRPFVLGTDRREWTGDGTPLRAGVSAFGVGGTNAHVLLEEPPARRAAEAVEYPVLVPVSAHDPAVLDELTGALHGHLLARPDLAATDVAGTLALGRRHLPARTTAIGRDAAELAASLAGSASPREPVGPLVFAFSGQGELRTGVAAALFARFPVFRDVLAECERVYRQEFPHSLLEPMLDGSGPGQPLPAEVAQPALFAFQAALTELWASVGVTPDLVTGHSLGEYAAWYAAGAMSLPDGLLLTARRGAAMAATDAGAMLALAASWPVADRIAGQAGVDIAAVNGPGAHVLSGPVGAIERAADLAERDGVGCRRVAVDVAFHSSLIERALPELRRAVGAVGWRPMRVPVVSGLAGNTVPAGSWPDAEHVVVQARQPVRFDRIVSTVDELGYRDVLEIGPGDVLARLGARLSPGMHWTATLRRSDDRVADLLAAVGEFYRGGLAVRWSAVNPSGGRVPLPVSPFRRTRFPAGGHSVDPPRTPPPAAVAEVADDAVAEVCALVARELRVPVSEIDPNRTFLALGADSLTLMGMVRVLHETFGVRIPARRLLEEAGTPRTLAAELGPRPVPAPQPAPETTAASRPAEREPTREPVAPPGELREFMDRQLALTERLVDRVTDLMSRQLAVLDGTAPAPEPAPREPARTPDTVPVHPTAAPPVQHPPPARAGRSTAAFSLYFFGDYPDEQQHDKYRLITEAARFADRHDFHALWLPERHFHSFGALFPNPSVLAAALATQTERIRLHAGSVVLPLHHPIRVAEEWSVVDNLSGGRVGLCVASGWHATDFALAPENFGKHRELMYDRLDTVRRLWAGEEVRATSGSGDPVDVRLHPRPVQVEPPLFVAVVGNPESYRRAAENGLGVVTNLMTQSVAQLSENIALYRRTRAEHGWDPTTGRVVVLVHTYLGGDAETARAEAFGPFCAYLRSSLSLFDQVTTSLGVDIDLEATPEEDIEFLLGRAYERYLGSRALIGSAETCAPVVDGLLDAGADEIACFVDFGVPTGKVLAALPTVDELRQRFLPGERRLPLSPAQRRIWFLDRLYPGQSIYHEPKAIRLTGPLDVQAFRGALAGVIARQPSLRTVFRDDGGHPYRLELAETTVDCPLLDRTGESEDDALREVLGTAGRAVFDLAHGPLLAARLIRLGSEHHLLFLSAHHIVFDSASTAALVGDLAAHYRCWPHDPDLPDLPVLRERQPTAEEVAADIQFWRERLADCPDLRLPTDHPRQATRSGRGAAATRELDGELAGAVAEFGRAHGVTVFMVLLGAVAAVLGRFARQEDLVLGTAVADRPAGAEGVVGLFLDTVALRVDLAGDPTFAELADRVRHGTLSAYEHRRVPFDELVGALNPDRDPGRNPLFGVMVEFENAAEVDFDPPRTAATLLDVPADRAPFDLSLYLTRHPDGIRVLVEYDTDLFLAGTVERLLDHLEHVLRRATETPAGRLSTLTAAAPADIERIAGWQGGPVAEPACLHELVEACTDRDPGATAIMAGTVELTYRELDQLANRVAHRLLATGIGAGDLVAVCLPRGPELIAALLGVLKSGAGYLPVDPALPAARIDYLMRDSAAALLLTEEFVARTDPAARGRVGVPVDPAATAYCIYTSGSTGRPKGVLVPHRGPANLVRWQVTQHRPLRTLQWTSPSFDVSVQEIFSTLAAGATLVLIGDELRADPAAVAEVVREHGVQRLFMPYTPLKYLMETGPDLPSLRAVVSAGEALVLTPALRRFFAEHPECALYNQYGPTEGSVIVTSQRVDPAGPATPPIGAPVAGVTVHVLDGYRQPVPVGAVGELYLGGLAVATGYLGRPDETAAAFSDALSAGEAGQRYYRTGDLARWRDDGTIDYLGRDDDQVKIRGYRVEPGEAQRALAELDGVRDAAVLARTDRSGDAELVAYVVPAPGTDAATLAARLRGVLPHYLVPGRWVVLERLPVTANGKLDTAGLPEPGTGTASAATPDTVLERALHALWCAELGVATVAVDRSFFAQGGHSLSAVRLLNRVADELGVACSMSEFFRAPTIRALALRGPAEAVVLDRAPLTSVQHRLWRRHAARSNPAVYNIAHRIDVTGELDPHALEQAVQGLVHRHPALRVRAVDDGGRLTAEVLAPEPVELPMDDLTSAGDARVEEWCRNIAAVAFALHEAPLFRVRLARVGEHRWTLLLVLHHMICDGASLGIIWRDLAALYRTAHDTGPALPPAPSHLDYARWEHEHLTDARRAELLAHWRTELSDVDIAPAPPLDRPRPAVLSGQGGLHTSTVPTEGVLAQAAEAGTTPYAVLASAFAGWLAGVCGQREVVLAVSTANRARAEHQDVVGMIGDAVLVRVRPEDGVHGLAESLYTALDHQELPLTDVRDAVAPDHDDRPFPPVLFTVVTTPPPELPLPGADTAVREIVTPGLARTELYVRITLAGEVATIAWEYSTDLFTPETIAIWDADLRAAIAEAGRR